MSRIEKTFFRFLEFFVIGFALGVGEDLVAIHFGTNATITLDTIFIAALVTLPFAIFSELVVDHPGFWHKLFRRANYD